MAYLGKQPLVGNYQVLDAIVATTTDTYALTKDNGAVAVFPQTPSNCIVSLNGVIQAPVDSYTISGSDIVFASALTASDSIDFITVLGDVLSIGTPTDGTVSLAKLSATGTKDATTFLRGDNTFASAGGDNTPAFEATLSANQSIAGNTFTKLQADSESFDTDSCYDNATNYRFTPTSSGKYFVYGTFYVGMSSGDDALVQCRILKNGDTANGAIEPTIRVKTDDTLTIQAHSIVTLNGSTDYVEFWVYQYDYVGGASYSARGNDTGRQFCNFGAFKLIGA
jgi:hypothetical protein